MPWLCHFSTSFSRREHRGSDFNPRATQHPSAYSCLTPRWWEGYTAVPFSKGGESGPVWTLETPATPSSVVFLFSVSSGFLYIIWHALYYFLTHFIKITILFLHVPCFSNCLKLVHPQGWVCLFYILSLIYPPIHPDTAGQASKPSVFLGKHVGWNRSGSAFFPVWIQTVLLQLGIIWFVFLFVADFTAIRWLEFDWNQNESM